MLSFFSLQDRNSVSSMESPGKLNKYSVILFRFNAGYTVNISLALKSWNIYRNGRIYQLELKY